MAGQSPAAEPPIIIKAARLTDGRGGAPLTPAVVRVEGERIAAVAAQLPIPANAKVIDLGDATLLPGLIDLHTHLTGRYGRHWEDVLVKATPITAVAQGFITAFPNMQVFLDELPLEDGGAIYHWTLTGKNTGPGGTGRPVRISGYEVWQIGADGLIARSRGYFDAEDYRRQLEAGN